MSMKTIGQKNIEQKTKRQETTAQEAKAAGRLRRYQKILKRSPAYGDAITRVQAAMKPDTAASLYLYVMAPALTEFIGWVLREAALAGKRRLYFLSRDGYQMYLIALQLAKLKQINIECRYLYVSRYSMRLPQYHLNPEKGIDMICTGGIDITPERILQRAALSTQEIGEILKDIGWQNKRREILDYRKIQKLKEILRREDRLLECLKKRSLEEYENAISYLEQEGLLSQTPYAIVDSGWVGTLQESIQTLIQSRRPGLKIEGYYFGMYELPQGADPQAYHAWYFSPEKGLRRKAAFSNSLFETICSADEGMTLYYRESNGRYLPMQDRRGNPNSLQIENNLKMLRAFLKQLQSSLKGEIENFPKGSDVFEEKLFRLFMARPTDLEVTAYGDSLFSDDVLEGNRRKAAAELTGQEIRGQRFWNRLLTAAGIRKTIIRESAWIEGSIVRYGKHVRTGHVHARFYKYAVFGRKQINAMRNRQQSRK